MSEININIIESYIQDYSARVERYLQDRKSKPIIAKSNEDCNNIFKVSDSELADILNAINKLYESKRILKFGISFSGSYAESSKLRKKCCNCPNNPMPYYQKNELRAKAETEIKLWKAQAELWLNSDDKNVQELTLTNKVSQKLNSEPRKIGKKFIR
jgi:hypothetical protein